MKLVKLITSPKPNKKYRALFDDGTYTDFGANKLVDGKYVPYDDYTIKKDPDQAERYRKRHKKDLETNDPKRAGYLSYYILWTAPTLNEGIRNYKKIISTY